MKKKKTKGFLGNKSLERLADEAGLKTFLRPFWDDSNKSVYEIVFLENHPVLRLFLVIVLTLVVAVIIYFSLKNIGIIG